MINGSTSVNSEPQCRIEISYIDPVLYTSIVDHDLRKDILKELYRQSLFRPISKKELARRLDIGYHQLFYQLKNHLSDFWCVEKEEKVRGTRRELISPRNRNAVYITLGAGNKVYMIDPLGGRFGPLPKVGVRCESCSHEQAEKCLDYMEESSFDMQVGERERQLLGANDRYVPFRPLDYAILSALKEITEGSSQSIVIPCRECSYIQNFLEIETE